MNWWGYAIVCFGFDAQHFELFLYQACFYIMNETLWMFRCSMFWAFFFIWYYNPTRDFPSTVVSMLNVLSFFFIVFDLLSVSTSCREFRCSTFWAFSLSTSFTFSFSDGKAEVSMLNVLSFFFILDCGNFLLWKKLRFDAQCFELFLYTLGFCVYK